MSNQAPFVFQTERRMVMLTGRSARTINELLEHIRQVSGSSIFYHTHHQYLSHHFEKPVFHDDFAAWTSLALLEEALAEKLVAIDIFSFSSIRQLREAIIKIIEDYLADIGDRRQMCLPGQEFHFCESKSFIMPSNIIVHDIPDFFAKLPKVSNPSLYFHFFEARLRLERPTNDFSAWLSYRGADDLAQAINQLNPYRMTMEELRDEIIKLGTTERLPHDRHTA
jgi:hypothetical protein